VNPHVGIEIVAAISPILVAIITVMGSVVVTKIERLQKDIRTNRGSANLGDAIDLIRDRVDTLNANQLALMKDVRVMKHQDMHILSRLATLEERMSEQ
jgi:hypothetical protein